MKITIETMHQSIQALNTLSQLTTLPSKISYRIGRAKGLIDNHLKKFADAAAGINQAFVASRNKLLESLAEKDEKGVLKKIKKQTPTGNLNEDGSSQTIEQEHFDLNEENLPIFEKLFQEMRDEAQADLEKLQKEVGQKEEEIPVLPIPLSSLPDGITPATFIPLDWLIVDDSEVENEG